MLSDLIYRLRALLRRERVEDELQEELQYHLEREAEKYRKTGDSQKKLCAARGWRLKARNRCGKGAVIHAAPSWWTTCCRTCATACGRWARVQASPS
jgi:hypothetical protein